MIVMIVLYIIIVGFATVLFEALFKVGNSICGSEHTGTDQLPPYK